MFKFNFLYFNLGIFPPVISIDTTQMSLCLSLLIFNLLYTPSEPSHFQAEWSQLFQPLLIWQTFLMISCPFTGLHIQWQLLHVSLLLGTPNLDPEFHMWPHQCYIEGKDHLSQPDGNTLPHTQQQDAVGHLCHKPLLAHVQLASTRTSTSLFEKLLSGQLSGACVLVHGFIPLQVLGSAFPIPELHKVPLQPFLQLAEIPWNGSMTLWCISRNSSCVSFSNSLRVYSVSSTR